MTKDPIRKFQIVSAALGAAIADREAELALGVGTLLYFDTDAIVGGIFLYHDLTSNFEREQMRRQEADLVQWLNVDDHDLVKSLWAMGYFGTIRMLSPHVLELVERARSRGGRLQPDDATTELLTEWGKLGPIKGWFDSVRESVHQPHEVTDDLIGKIVASLSWKQFVILDAITLPAWQMRREHSARWLDIPEQPEDSVTELASIAKTLEVTDALSAWRPDKGDPREADRNFVDATAIVALARRRRASNQSTGLMLRRLHTQTKAVVDAVDSLSDAGSMDIGTDSERHWRDDVPAPLAALRSSEYLLLRSCFRGLRFDQVSERTKESIQRDREELKELRDMRRELNKHIASATLRTWLDGRQQLAYMAVIERVLADVNAGAFARGVLLDTEGRATRELSRRVPKWAPMATEMQTRAGLIAAMLPGMRTEVYVEELRALREFRRAPAAIRVSEVAALRGRGTDGNQLLADSGMMRWLGGLGLNERSKPATERQRAAEIIWGITNGTEQDQLAYIEFMQREVRLDSLRKLSGVTANDAIIGCSLAWLFNSRRVVAASLEALGELDRERALRGTVTAEEMLGFDVLHFACRAIQGFAHVRDTLVEAEIGWAGKLLDRITSVKDRVPDESAACMYAGVSWGCTYASERARPALQLSSVSGGLDDRLVAIGLAAAEMGWKCLEGLSSEERLGFECMLVGSGVLLSAARPFEVREEDRSWSSRGDAVLPRAEQNIWVVDAVMWDRFKRAGLRGRALARVAKEAIDRVGKCVMIGLLEPHQRAHVRMWESLAGSHH